MSGWIPFDDFQSVDRVVCDFSIVLNGFSPLHSQFSNLLLLLPKVICTLISKLQLFVPLSFEKLLLNYAKSKKYCSALELHILRDKNNSVKSFLREGNCQKILTANCKKFCREQIAINNSKTSIKVIMVWFCSHLFMYTLFQK